MQDQTINYDLFLVIDEDDDQFYNDILPTMFRALAEHNVLFSIVTHDYDGSTHYVLTGTKDNIRAVIETAFAHDDQICDDLDCM